MVVVGAAGQQRAGHLPGVSSLRVVEVERQSLVELLSRSTMGTTPTIIFYGADGSVAQLRRRSTVQVGGQIACCCQKCAACRCM